jgi:hypothetical protein
MRLFYKKTLKLVFQRKKTYIFDENNQFEYQFFFNRPFRAPFRFDLLCLLETYSEKV